MDLLVEPLKELIKSLLPPIFLKMYRNLRKRKTATPHSRAAPRTHEGVYKNFHDVDELTGYDSQDSLLTVYLETNRKLGTATAPRVLPQANQLSPLNNPPTPFSGDTADHSDARVDFGLRRWNGHFIHRLS